MKRHAWKSDAWDYEFFKRGGRRSPKQWARPRSRASREAVYASPQKATLESATAILKRLWSVRPQKIMDRPEWAKVALRFGWLTPRGFAAVPEFWTGRMTASLDEVLYSESPFFKFCEKRAAGAA